MLGFPGGASGKESACQCRRRKRCGLDPWVGKIPWRRKWQATPIFLPGKFHGQRSLGGCSPRGRKKLVRTEPWNAHTATWLFPASTVNLASAENLPVTLAQSVAAKQLLLMQNCLVRGMFLGPWSHDYEILIKQGNLKTEPSYSVAYTVNPESLTFSEG